MYKVMWLMKRKAHLTHEEFREHFERSHAPMAQKFAGHLFAEYRRNYPCRSGPAAIRGFPAAGTAPANGTGT